MTTTQTWPDHLLDLDEWDAMPEDTSRRIELAEGVLLVSPRPRFRHQAVTMGLASHLDAAADGRWRALVEVDVVIDSGPPPTVRAPDVSLVPVSFVDDRTRCDAAELLAVFEVLSPGTMRVDRVAKLHEYAERGVPVYGIVDPGPPVTLAEFRLTDDAVYRLVTEHRGRASLTLGVTVDLSALEENRP